MASTRQLTAQHRRDIARLKRLLKDHEKKIAFLEARERKRLSRPDAPAADLLNGARFSPTSVRAQRRRLKLSAAEYGKLAGVSGQTIYLWEQGKSRPRTAQLASLVALRKLGRRHAVRQLAVLETGEEPRTSRRRGRKRKPR
jgi:DNA-binding transcriptional regulator YiaG